MTANSKRVTKGLLDRLLKAQTRRSEREKRMPFGEKLKIVDQLVAEHDAAIKRDKVKVRDFSLTGGKPLD
jgi:hypothetical protein